ncbi:hypothetical protein SY89_03197 [Halolamina pelagica]|uniref:Uncharacterized protein n=1 Tax=Halolamina pelagica TaxID=699431 RepID=A0A0N8HZA5_9EURY|nr:hypothetical protein SY89_03197 [Halolamina pelagica]
MSHTQTGDRADTGPDVEIRIRDKPHQPMHGRYSDFAELRPTGEASHIPDTRLDDGCEGAPGGNASRRALVATLMRRRPPMASAGPVGRQSQTARRNAGSVSLTISGVTPLARTRQRRRRASASSTWSSSRPRSTAPSRRAAPRRTSSPLTRRSRPSMTTHSSTTSTRRRRASWPNNGPHFPTRYRCPQRRESGFSVPPVTGLGGTDRKRRRIRSRARHGSTTSVGTASATRRVSTRSSTTPTTRCGWFQR